MQVVQSIVTLSSPQNESQHTLPVSGENEYLRRPCGAGVKRDRVSRRPLFVDRRSDRLAGRLLRLRDGTRVRASLTHVDPFLIHRLHGDDV